MVLTRLIEPTSKAQVPHVLDDLDLETVSVRTLFRPLGHCVERGYREAISQALFEYVTATRGLALYLQA
jgi:transposase, IS4 family protein